MNTMPTPSILLLTRRVNKSWPDFKAKTYKLLYFTISCKKNIDNIESARRAIAHVIEAECTWQLVLGNVGQPDYCVLVTDLVLSNFIQYNTHGADFFKTEMMWCLKRTFIF